MAKLPWGTRQNLSDDEFFNRTRELTIIKNLLYSTSQANPPEILFSGVRGVGKTVFLNKIKRDLDKEGYLVVLIDFSTAECYQRNNLSLNGLLKHYYNELIKECHRKGLSTITKEISKFYKTKNFKLKDITVVKDIPIPIFGGEEDIDKLNDFVLELPQQIYENNSDILEGVIIMLDEFQIIKDLDKYLDSFLWMLRGHIQNHNNTAYIITGSMSLHDPLLQNIASNNGVFGGRMLTQQLTPFSKNTTKEYLDEKMPSLHFNNESFDRFYNCTNGSPYYVNTLANYLPENVELTDKIVIDIFDENLDQIVKKLLVTWEKLSNREKDIFIELMEKELIRKDLAKKLEVQSGSLSKPLNKLLNLDLIKVNNGVYAVNELLLKRWLTNEYKEKGYYPYRFD
ncbi:MAG: hypothetical protein BZ137_00640 [Methanosphaera sp. rholeuAM130]|nr:MAG: hypothetical protein BZ137_00640 [Methanosphaera sp. rholeuAM130]